MIACIYRRTIRRKRESVQRGDVQNRYPDEACSLRAMHQAVYGVAHTKGHDMTSKRLTLSIDEEAAALLDGVGVRGRYVSDLVTQRWRTCQQALAWLHEEGIELATVRACVVALSGVWELGLGGGDTTPCRAALADLPLDGGVDDRTCRALCAVAAEYWSYHAGLRRRLDDAAMVPRKPKPRPHGRPPAAASCG